MIEVEKSFRPTEEELTRLLDGAEFVEEIQEMELAYDHKAMIVYAKEMKYI
jgi:hypothetical protein